MADVIIVGAGPTGLLLAGDLAEAGVAVTVLERRDGKVSNLSRAFGVHARTLEQLDARGLADDLIPTGAALNKLRLFDRVVVDLGRLPSRFPFLLITPQYHVERLLIERALKAGAEIAYNAEVTGVSQSQARATVKTGARAYQAAYVVGTDGFHSAVRQAAGLPFPGKSVLKSIMLADVRLAEQPAEMLTVNGVGDSFAFLAPFGDGYYRIFAWDRRNPVPDDQPLTLGEIQDVARRALGSDYGMHDPRWLSRFHSDERQVPHYRVGRVFLAGDAAHVHSPAGGQGMNTGLQDAANLGWKLAAVLRGAPPELLDSYEQERHPVGKSVLRSSGTLIRAAMIKSAPGRAVRGFVARGVLSVPGLRRKITGQLSGVGYRYPHPAGAHPSVGERVGDVTFPDGGRLYEALRGGHFVLMGAAGVTGGQERVVVKPYNGVNTLVRPDGHVGWAGTDTTSLRQALISVGL